MATTQFGNYYDDGNDDDDDVNDDDDDNDGDGCYVTSQQLCRHNLGMRKQVGSWPRDTDDDDENYDDVTYDNQNYDDD